MPRESTHRDAMELGTKYAVLFLFTWVYLSLLVLKGEWKSETL